MANTPTASTDTRNPHEQAARAAKVQRIVTAICAWSDASLDQLESIANVLAFPGPVGAAFAAAVWARLGETTSRDMTTRAEVARQIEQFVAACRERSGR